MAVTSQLFTITTVRHQSSPPPPQHASLSIFHASVFSPRAAALPSAPSTNIAGANNRPTLGMPLVDHC